MRREPKTPCRGNLLLSPARFWTEIFRSKLQEFREGPVKDLPRHLGEAGSGPEILRDLIQIDFIREIAYET